MGVNRKFNQGFTLIEMVIVILCIGVLSTLSVQVILPKIQSFEADGLQDEIYYLLIYARKAALVTQKAVEFQCEAKIGIKIFQTGSALDAPISPHFSKNILVECPRHLTFSAEGKVYSDIDLAKSYQIKVEGKIIRIESETGYVN